MRSKNWSIPSFTWRNKTIRATVSWNKAEHGLHSSHIYGWSFLDARSNVLSCPTPRAMGTFQITCYQALSDRFGERVLCFGNHEDGRALGTIVSCTIGNAMATQWKRCLYQVTIEKAKLFSISADRWLAHVLIGIPASTGDAQRKSWTKFAQDTLQKLVRQPTARGWAQFQRAVPFEGWDSELTKAHHD